MDRIRDRFRIHADSLGAEIHGIPVRICTLERYLLLHRVCWRRKDWDDIIPLQIERDLIISNFFNGRVVTWIKSSAMRERITGVSRWTGTNRNVISCLAVGVCSTDALTRIDASFVFTNQVSSTLGIVQTFGPVAVVQGVAYVPS